MGVIENHGAIPETALETVNHVTIASCAIQQLPKLLHAMNNMARRSRRRLHRKGVFLGGQWIEKDEVPKRKGILKKGNDPGLDQLSAYNEFWKTYYFSFHHDENPKNCWSGHNNFGRNSCWRFYRRTTPQPFYCVHEHDNYQSPTVVISQLCIQNLQGGLYKSQTSNFLESYPLPSTSPESLQSILFRHLSRIEINPQEQEILFQLQYLKILFNTPLHKLVRERPKEYLVPLPRRTPRGGHNAVASKPYYARSLTTHQTVLTLPAPHHTFKFLSLGNLPFGRTSFFTFTGSDDEEILKWKRRSSTAIPKGVAFITYPDSVDETSFEGTIGGRNMISWEKGTKFPQMGVDQSNEFKYKKEMGKQQMIQSRLRAAKIYRRIYCENWNNYVNGNKQGVRRVPSKQKVFRRNKPIQRSRVGSSNALFKSWFKLAHLKQSIRVMNESLRFSSSNLTLREEEGIISIPESADGPNHQRDRLARAARIAECKRRIKMFLGTIAKYLTCGLFPYFMKGECRIFKRRKIRKADSTERCPPPPLPKVESIFANVSVVKDDNFEKISV